LPPKGGKGKRKREKKRERNKRKDGTKKQLTLLLALGSFPTAALSRTVHEAEKGGGKALCQKKRKKRRKGRGERNPFAARSGYFRHRIRSTGVSGWKQKRKKKEKKRKNQLKREKKLVETGQVSVDPHVTAPFAPT